MAEPQNDSVTCPRCLGRGTEFGLVNRRSMTVFDPEQCHMENWDCPECNGRQWVTKAEFADYQQRVQRGWEMQGERVAKRQRLRDAAAERGMTIVELSNLERGEKPRG